MRPSVTRDGQVSDNPKHQLSLANDSFLVSDLYIFAPAATRR
jgi:hypothetical protein